MKLTDREIRIWLASKPGDIVPAGDLLLRFDHFDEITGRAGAVVIQCEWFARCANDATYLIGHPILGYMPACVRCAASAL